MTWGIEDRLRKHLILESSNVDEAVTGVAGVLNGHALAPRSPALQARLYANGGEYLKICMLEYGAAVTVETQPASNFLIVQSAVRGNVHVQGEGGRWTVKPGSGVILPAAGRLKLDWDASAIQVLVKIPLVRLHEMYVMLFGLPAPADLAFEPRLALGTAPGAGWSALLNHYYEQLDDPVAPAWHKRSQMAEQALLGHLLCYFAARRAGADERRIAPRHVRRAREFIESSLSEPINLSEIAKASGVSARSLSRAYQEHFGISPMAAVRMLRLDRIHEELASSSDDVSIADVAFRWGWTHLGRLAAAYRERYGQLPNRTLRQGLLHEGGVRSRAAG